MKLLLLQRENLLKRWKQKKKRNAFIIKNLKKILPLSMDGWPKTSNMKDYPKWLDIVIQAKIKGVYGIGTSNCDVIAQLNRFAKEISKQ